MIIYLKKSEHNIPEWFKNPRYTLKHDTYKDEYILGDADRLIYFRVHKLNKANFKKFKKLLEEE